MIRQHSNTEARDRRRQPQQGRLRRLLRLPACGGGQFALLSPDASPTPAPNLLRCRPLRRACRKGTVRRPGSRCRPVQGRDHRWNSAHRPFCRAVDRRLDQAGNGGRAGVPEDPDARAAQILHVPGGRRRVAPVEQHSPGGADGSGLQGHDRGAAPGSRQPVRRRAERQGAAEDPRHHAAESDDRGDDQAVRRVRRIPVPRRRDGRAARDGALGLAARRPPPDRQLLRARRPGRDDAGLHGLRAGDCRDRPVRGDAGAAGRAEQGPGADAVALARAAAEGDDRARQEGRQQVAGAGVSRQPAARLRRD